MMEDADYEDHLEKLGWFEYKPVRSTYPRPGHIGEQVYFEDWQKLVRELPQYGYHVPNSMLVDILWQHPGYVTQRHATICTSFVIWLGTNCGAAIRLGADRLRTEKYFGGRAWLMSWAAENHRASCANHGVRTIEHLLAPEDHFGRDHLSPVGGEHLVKRPELTVDDLECIDHLVYWLGEKGQDFIRIAEDRIDKLHKWERVKARRPRDPPGSYRDATGELVLP